MKSASSELKAFVASSNVAHMADLLTITCRNGVIYRWASTPTAITIGENTWQPAGTLAPGFTRTKLSEASGGAIATLDITILGMGWLDSSGTYNLDGDGQTLTAATIVGYFDSAMLQIDRLVYESPGGPVHTIDKWYTGIVSIAEPIGTDVVLRAKSNLVLLQQSLPRYLLQPQCGHTVYSPACGLIASSWAVTGEVDATSNKSIIYSQSATLLAKATGYFNYGSIYVADTKEYGSIDTYEVDGGWATITLNMPLAFTPPEGSDIVVLPGCDKSWDRCNSFFDNSLHYRGFPRVPLTRAKE